LQISDNNLVSELDESVARIISRGITEGSLTPTDIVQIGKVKIGCTKYVCQMENGCYTKNFKLKKRSREHIALLSLTERLNRFNIKVNFRNSDIRSGVPEEIQTKIGKIGYSSVSRALRTCVNFGRVEKIKPQKARRGRPELYDVETKNRGPESVYRETEYMLVARQLISKPIPRAIIYMQLQS
jgi:hypothetical protein